MNDYMHISTEDQSIITIVHQYYLTKLSSRFTLKHYWLDMLCVSMILYAPCTKVMYVFLFSCLLLTTQYWTIRIGCINSIYVESETCHLAGTVNKVDVELKCAKLKYTPTIFSVKTKGILKESFLKCDSLHEMMKNLISYKLVPPKQSI